LPLFYSQFLDQIFSVASIIVLNSEEFGLLVDDSDILVNVKQAAGTGKTYLTALHEVEHKCGIMEPQIGVLCAGVDCANILWEHVCCCNDDSDFVSKTQVSSVVIIDFTKSYIDTDNILQNNMDADVVILINSRRDEAAYDFRLAGAHCVLDIKQHSFQPLLPFLEKACLITGRAPVSDCLEQLQIAEIRLFGDRYRRIRLGPAQLARQSIVDAQKDEPSDAGRSDIRGS
uniref:Centromere protein M n=1 Tax=Gongylonema pulchrum TaxID=637853 RepID=A0A183E5L6_9BILA